MSLPISKPSSDSVILGISVTVLAVIIVLLSWRVGAYIELQNQSIKNSIQGMEQQIGRGQQMDLTSQRLMQAFLTYINQTKDQSLARLLNPYVQLLPVFGIQIQQQPAGAPAGQPAAAPSAAAPAAK
jgi:hypothetical protein